MVIRDRTESVLSGVYQEAQTATDAIRERQSSQIACAKGCSSCCQTRLELFPVEFDRIKSAFDTIEADLKRHLRAEAKAKWASGICPLLHNDACTVYEIRPLICRTHGFPLRSGVRVRTGESVAFCHLNFRDCQTIEDKDIIDVDEFGMLLIGANLEYCRSSESSISRAETRPVLDALD